MSQIQSVSPASATLVSGQSVDITVEVSDVAADGTATVTFVASDGTTGEVAITINNEDLEVLLGTGPVPAANEIRATVDSGSLAVVSVVGSTVVLRYTAP
jgi:hypothetical protein